MRKVLSRLVGWWVDTGCLAPVGEVGVDGTIILHVWGVIKIVCDVGLVRDFSLGRDLSMAGLGVVGVAGLEKDFVYRKHTCDTTQRYTTLLLSHVCQDSDEVPVEMNGLVEHQQNCLVYSHHLPRSLHGYQYITHLQWQKRGQRERVSSN